MALIKMDFMTQHHYTSSEEIGATLRIHRLAVIVHPVTFVSPRLLLNHQTDKLFYIDHTLTR